MNIRDPRRLLTLLSGTALVLALLFHNNRIAMGLALFCTLAAVVLLYRNLAKLSDISPENLKMATLKGMTVANILILAGVILFAFLLEKQIITLSEEMAPRLLGCFLGLLILWFGNAAPKLPFNRYTGLRLPWTIQDEGAWLVAHRTLGYLSLPTALFCFAGTAVRLPMEQWIKIWFMGPLLVWIGIPTALSWLYFRKKWK